MPAWTLNSLATSVGSRFENGSFIKALKESLARWESVEVKRKAIATEVKAEQVQIAEAREKIAKAKDDSDQKRHACELIKRSWEDAERS